MQMRSFTLARQHGLYCPQDRNFAFEGNGTALKFNEWVTPQNLLSWCRVVDVVSWLHAAVVALYYN
jgi:hypothetical protein